jgi:hypothetical protein
MNIYGHLLPDSGARVASSLDEMIDAARGSQRNRSRLRRRPARVGFGP